jgi:hypothetical protein
MLGYDKWEHMMEYTLWKLLNKEWGNYQDITIWSTFT